MNRDALHQGIRQYLNAGGQIHRLPPKQSKQRRKKPYIRPNHQDAYYRDWLTEIRREVL